MSRELLRNYMDMIEITNEGWGTPTMVSPEEQGKYEGKTKEELLSQYLSLIHI